MVSRSGPRDPAGSARAPCIQQIFRILFQPLTLREDERRDLIAFLQNLTDETLLHDPRWSDPWSAP